MINRIRNRSDEIKSREHTTNTRFFVTHSVRSSRMTTFCHPEMPLRRVSIVKAEMLKQIQHDKENSKYEILRHSLRSFLKNDDLLTP